MLSLTPLELHGRDITLKGCKLPLQMVCPFRSKQSATGEYKAGEYVHDHPNL